jgi:N-acetylmuramoyl-L-alanine amidase
LALRFEVQQGYCRRGARWAVFCALALGWVLDATAAELVRRDLGPQTTAVLRGGRMLFLECALPRGEAAKGVLAQYLADPEKWKAYRDRMAVAIPFASLNEVTQRAVLEAVFPGDHVDGTGWWHTVTAEGEQGSDALWTLAEWLTGLGTNHQKIMKHPRNRGLSLPLKTGSQVLIPRELLKDAMKKLSPKRVAPDTNLVAPAAANGELQYGSDREGPYAVYRLKKGEALYSAVVVRFTDYSLNEDIHRACDVIQQRSGIHDVRRMSAGQRIMIPMEMLSDRYRPVGSEERTTYEQVREEARRLQGDRVRTKDLEGVVVILDPGHGGRDQGAPFPKIGLYEDEINYDIACRIKALLEQTTRAKVYMTLLDRSQGYTPVNDKRFVHDTDEELLTTPRYGNDDAKVSANLRWYLSNSIYRQERKAGVDERKIVFASIHCDALYNETLRGAMVYVPGANYRRDVERPSNPIYARFKEVQEQRASTSDAAARRRDEALSRNFAESVLDALRRHDPPIKVHSAGDPIRNVIRQSGGRAYLPAVLRNCGAPTKILIECANLTNPQDREHAADPRWRQWFAEAFVQALLKQFA